MLQLSKLRLRAAVAELADAQDLGTETGVLQTGDLQENKTT